MHDALGNHHALSRRELNGAAFDVDEQLALDHVEELVVVIVFVPVVFAFNHSQADHRFVHLAERLVEPLVWVRIGDGFFVDDARKYGTNMVAGVSPGRAGTPLAAQDVSAWA